MTLGPGAHCCPEEQPWSHLDRLPRAVTVPARPAAGLRAWPALSFRVHVVLSWGGSACSPVVSPQLWERPPWKRPVWAGGGVLGAHHASWPWADVPRGSCTMDAAGQAQKQVCSSWSPGGGCGICGRGGRPLCSQVWWGYTLQSRARTSPHRPSLCHCHRHRVPQGSWVWVRKLCLRAVG